MNETNYTEIFRLKEMLEQANIPFVFTDNGFDCQTFRYYHYHIEYPEGVPTDKRVCSVIQGYGSFGGQHNLLEIMGLLSPEEEQDDIICGWLTAENVFERIRKHYEKPHEIKGANKVIDRIKAAPAADVAEVVRCKDCKHCDKFYSEKKIGEEPKLDYFCRLDKRSTTAYDFCSYGKKAGK